MTIRKFLFIVAMVLILGFSACVNECRACEPEQPKPDDRIVVVAV